MRPYSSRTARCELDAARAVGMIAVLIEQPRQSRLYGGSEQWDYRIENLAEVPDLVRRLAGADGRAALKLALVTDLCRTVTLVVKPSADARGVRHAASIAWQSGINLALAVAHFWVVGRHEL